MGAIARKYQRKYQSSASLAFVRGIHRGPVNSPHKWPVTRKMVPFDDVIMNHGVWIRTSIQLYFMYYIFAITKRYRQCMSIHYRHSYDLICTSDSKADSAFDTIMVHQVAITARHSPHYCWGQKPHELQGGEWWSHTHSWFVNRAALGLIKSPLNNFFTRDISDFVMYLAYRFTYTGIWCHRSWAGVAYQIGIRISIFRQGLFIVKHWKITNGNLVLHTPGQLCDCCPQLMHLTWANVHGFYIHGFSASIWGKT